MSHHFDSAADRADGRINPCDLYIFPGAAGTTALILTVNPDTGRSSRTTFRPAASYEFLLASDAGAARQVNRIGQAMFRPLFFNPPDSEREMDALNAGSPALDHDTYGEQVRTVAGTIARLAGLPDPDASATRVAEAFLPDVVTDRPGPPAAFHPGHGNGRSLGDNAFDRALAVLAGSDLGNSSTPPPAAETFPYLSAPRPADLPPLIGSAPATG